MAILHVHAIWPYYIHYGICRLDWIRPILFSYLCGLRPNSYLMHPISPNACCHFKNLWKLEIKIKRSSKNQVWSFQRHPSYDFKCWLVFQKICSMCLHGVNEHVHLGTLLTTSSQPLMLLLAVVVYDSKPEPSHCASLST